MEPLQIKEGKRERPCTIWVDAPNNGSLGPIRSSSPGRTSNASGTTAAAILEPRAQTQPQAGHLAPKISPIASDPWETYEPIIKIDQGALVLLARHRRRKADLVHVQSLKHSSSIVVLCDTVSRLSHPSFLSLLECYHHGDEAFLVWEPAALSVTQILASKCLITEREIAAVVRPVLEGIRHLKGQGRALAKLDADTILLTEEGAVRIAGVGTSCDISESEMDCATLKMLAMADIVARLLGKNPPSYEWSAAARGLPTRLKTLSVEELLQDDFLGQHEDGELKMLVNVSNKTAWHRIESYSMRK